MRKLVKLALVSLIGVLPWKADARQWIAVVAPDLREAVEPLCKQRIAEGWNVTVLEATRDRTDLLDQIARLTESDKESCLVLVGNVSETSTGTSVASGKGTIARMTGKLSDHSWSTADGRITKPVPTGRLPARSPEEVGVMVRKILTWPERARNIGPFPQARFVVGNHGLPQPLSAMADELMNRLALNLVRQFPGQWYFEAMMHINGSPWQVFFPDVGPAAAAMMKSPATVLAYMGHSNRRGAASANQALLTVNEWSSLPPDAPGIGLFFSCGCQTCDFVPNEEAFGVAAMRAPGGPSAVIGSQGETYAAMGYLALSGMFTAGSNAEPSQRTLGKLWEGVQYGLREGKIDMADFKMMDMADGSGGKLPIEVQRSEHLESWMLLGDPAMLLLPEALPIQLHANTSDSGNEVEVSGKLPQSLSNAKLRLTLERHPSTIRTDLPEVPPSGDPRRDATRKRRALSNDHVLATTEPMVEGGAFKATFALPPSLPSGPLVIRASTGDQAPAATGIVQITRKVGEK